MHFANIVLFILCKNTKFQSNSQHISGKTSEFSVVYPLQKYKISKQFTTLTEDRDKLAKLFILCKNTKFQSNSQPPSVLLKARFSCLSSAKIQNFKAIHNQIQEIKSQTGVVYPLQKYKISKQFTTAIRIA